MQLPPCYGGTWVVIFCYILLAPYFSYLLQPRKNQSSDGPYPSHQFDSLLSFSRLDKLNGFTCGHVESLR